jgi:hypothetical protein
MGKVRHLLPILILCAACAGESTGGHTTPPPAADVVEAQFEASIKAGETKTGHLVLNQYTTGCSLSGDLNLALLGECTSFTYTAGMAIRTSSIRAVLVNGAGARTERIYPVQVVLPDEPSGPGFVLSSTGGTMGRSVTLDLDVANEEYCILSVFPSLGEHGARVQQIPQPSACPDRTTVNMGAVIAPGFVQWVRLEAWDTHPQNVTLRDSIAINQIVAEVQVDSPQSIIVVNGRSNEILIRSPNCSFLKPNPPVHNGTEFSDTGEFPDVSISNFRDACHFVFTFGGTVDTGDRYFYLASRKKNGTYTTPLEVKYTIVDP